LTGGPKILVIAVIFSLSIREWKQTVNK